MIKSLSKLVVSFIFSIHKFDLQSKRVCKVSLVAPLLFATGTRRPKSYARGRIKQTKNIKSASGAPPLTLPITITVIVHLPPNKLGRLHYAKFAAASKLACRYITQLTNASARHKLAERMFRTIRKHWRQRFHFLCIFLVAA